MADLKAMAVIEVVKGENKFTFMVPNGIGFGEAFDACYEIMDKLQQEMKRVLEASKPAPEAAPAEKADTAA